MHRLPTTELSTDVVWHGHTLDLPRLVRSAMLHCSCGRDSDARPCSTHQLLADQHTLDHLAFARSVLNRLVEEEWRAPATLDSRSDTAEWCAFLRACASGVEQQPAEDSLAECSDRAQVARRNRGSPTVLWLGLIALLAFVLILGVHGPGSIAQPVLHQIATWQTR